MPDDSRFQENVRNSFLKVRNDISELKEAIKAQNDRILLIEKQISDLKQKEGGWKYLSIGNEGVGNWLTTGQPPGNHLPTNMKMPKIDQPIEEDLSINDQPKDTKDIQKDVIKMIQGLTNKEFTLFLSIIELESIKRDGVTYDDLAIKHSLSRRVINFHIKNMLLKGIPVNIVGRPNEKTLIFIKKEFKELNINQDLIKLRYYIASKGLKADHLDEF